MNRAMHPHSAGQSQPARRQQPRIGRGAVVAWGLVLAAAMLSFFVHLVSDHTARAQAHHLTAPGLLTAALPTP